MTPRLTPGHDEAIRMTERLEAAAIAVREGWINRTGLRAIAFRPEEVDNDELDGFFDSLVQSGRFETQHGRFSGRHGRHITQYRATSKVVRHPEAEDDEQTE